MLVGLKQLLKKKEIGLNKNGKFALKELGGVNVNYSNLSLLGLQYFWLFNGYNFRVCLSHKEIKVFFQDVVCSKNFNELRIGCSFNKKQFLFFESKKFLNRFFNLLKQLIFGSIFGYRGELELRGLGFRGFVSLNKLYLDLGGCHWVCCDIDKGVEIKFNGKYHILLKSLNLGKLQLFIRKIENLFKVNVYTGMGLRNSEKTYIMKVGKVRDGN